MPDYKQGKIEAYELKKGKIYDVFYFSGFFLYKNYCYLCLCIHIH